MIPLVWLLMAWLVLMAVFALVSLMTVLLMLRFGVKSIQTYLSTALFLGVTIIALLATAGYLSGVDWTQNLNIFSSVSTVIPL